MTKLSTDGLILRAQKVGESDRLVSILTRSNGMVKAFSSGALNIKSKNHAGTQLLCYSSFVLSKGKDTYRVSESQPIETFPGLREDILKLSLAEYFCEICAHLAPEEQAEDYLRLVLNSLSLLANDRCPADVLKAVTELKLLTFSGYSPSVFKCDVCDSDLDGECFFDITQAVSWCSQHTEIPGGVFLPAGVAAAVRHIVLSPLEKVYSFKLPEKSMKILSAVSERYLLSQTERTFKTLEFYKRVI